MRDILRILSNDLAENLYFSNANCMMEFSSSFNLQYLRICFVFICELVVIFSFLKRCFWISRAASTRFLICSDVSHCSSVVSSSNFTGETSTCMSILSSIGRLTLLR